MQRLLGQLLHKILKFHYKALAELTFWGSQGKPKDIRPTKPQVSAIISTPSQGGVFFYVFWFPDILITPQLFDPPDHTG